jgi:hypothetical protein
MALWAELLQVQPLPIQPKHQRLLRRYRLRMTHYGEYTLLANAFKRRHLYRGGFY